jgi:hypothetical protein
MLFGFGFVLFEGSLEIFRLRGFRHFRQGAQDFLGTRAQEFSF